jgi:hypothetical protein
MIGCGELHPLLLWLGCDEMGKLVCLLSVIKGDLSVMVCTAIASEFCVGEGNCEANTVLFTINSTMVNVQQW